MIITIPIADGIMFIFNPPAFGAVVRSHSRTPVGKRKRVEVNRKACPCRIFISSPVPTYNIDTPAFYNRFQNGWSEWYCYLGSPSVAFSVNFRRTKHYPTTCPCRNFHHLTHKASHCTPTGETRCQNHFVLCRGGQEKNHYTIGFIGRKVCGGVIEKNFSCGGIEARDGEVHIPSSYNARVSTWLCGKRICGIALEKIIDEWCFFHASSVGLPSMVFPEARVMDKT